MTRRSPAPTRVSNSRPMTSLWCTVRTAAALPQVARTLYPISSFTWLLVPSKFSDATKRDALKGFVKWMLADGQNYAEALSYAKLPREVIAKEVKAIDKIQ